MSGLEGLAGTPVRSHTPIDGIGSGSSSAIPAGVPQSATGNNLDDLLGVFGNGGDSAAAGSGGFGAANDDLMNGFGGLDLSGSGGNSQSSAPKKSNEDILSLF